MKKIGLILMIAAVMVACGNKTKEAEQARLDSIATADSIAKVQAIADSIAQIQADSLAKVQAVADSIATADSIANAAKGIVKKAVAKPVVKPVTKTEVKPATTGEFKPVVTEVKAPVKKEKTLEEIKKESRDAKANQKAKELGF